MRWRLDIRVFAGVGLIALLAACGGTEENSSGSSSATPSASAELPTAVLSAAELSAWEADARGFVDRFNAEYQDAEAAFADFTDDAAIVDPSNGDYRIAPKSEVVTRWDSFVRDYPDYSARTTGGFLDLAAGAYLTDVGVFAELAAALPDGLLHELRVFRFTQDQTATSRELELWYLLEDQEALQEGCLIPDGCGPAVRDLVDRYLAGWSSGDPARISDLYRDDATFADSLLGVEASGAADIGLLSEMRFGSNSTVACSPSDIYVQTNGGDPVATGNPDPDGGKIAGVALVYRCGMGTRGKANPVSSVSLLMLGTRPAGNAPIEIDPTGLIVSEEVLHDPAGLLSAGVAR
jgi:hypothetical protein